MRPLHYAVFTRVRTKIAFETVALRAGSVVAVAGKYDFDYFFRSES